MTAKVVLDACIARQLAAWWRPLAMERSLVQLLVILSSSNDRRYVVQTCDYVKHVTMSPGSIIWYWPKIGDALTAG